MVGATPLTDASVTVDAAALDTGSVALVAAMTGGLLPSVG